MFSKKSMVLKRSKKIKSPAANRMAAIMVFGFIDLNVVFSFA